jgi:hypothetical protein
MNAISGLYNRRIRGFRVINFAFVIVLLVLMFGLYFAKTRASGDSAATARTERQIVAEHRNIRLLQAKVANLEQPDNITRLSGYVGLAPISATHEITPDKLPEVAAGHHAAPPVAAPAAPSAPVTQ